MSSTDVNGLSLMHYAVRSPRVQILDLLYDHGCSIQVVDKKKQTPTYPADCPIVRIHMVYQSYDISQSIILIKQRLNGISGRP